jgi:hypothetical protein
MQFTKSLLILCLAGLAMAGTRARSQANVVENQTNAIYVDSAKGTDVITDVSLAGTAAKPMQTIQAAVNLANTKNQQKVGTKIIVNPGVYRESVAISTITNQSAATLTIEASSTGSSVISGADVMTGWSALSGHANAYYHWWPYNFGDCALPSGWPTSLTEVGRRTEMVFVNNEPLTQVMSESDLRAGTFFVDQATSQMLISPPTGTDMSTAEVETAVRPQTLTVYGRSNVVIRGMVLTHATSCIDNTGAVISDSSNVLVDSVQANWNNWGGLGIYSSSNVTVENSVASHNGGVGFLGYRAVNLYMSYNESDFNNWRGAQGAYYNWAMGGTKLFETHTATIQGFWAYGNQAQGLWFDTDNKNITIGDANISGSAMSAVQLEANEGPIAVKDSHLCNSLAGVTALNTEGITLEDNVLYNNGGIGSYSGEFFLGGVAGGHWIPDWQTGEWYDLKTTGTVLTGNTIEDGSSGQDVFGTYLSGSDWSDFTDSLKASNNGWYDPTTQYAFKMPDNYWVNLAGWKNWVWNDWSSWWWPPSTSPWDACAIPAQSYTDFAVNLNGQSYTMNGGTGYIEMQVNSYGWGTVSLWASGLPSGVSASFSRTSLVSGTVYVTLYATKYAANATTPITFWAVSGSRVHSVTVYVHVVPA